MILAKLGVMQINLNKLRCKTNIYIYIFFFRNKKPKLVKGEIKKLQINSKNKNSVL
jgi:hypothetical protein